MTDKCMDLLKFCTTMTAGVTMTSIRGMAVVMAKVRFKFRVRVKHCWGQG